MRKIVMMALAAFVWKQVKARWAAQGANPSTGTQGPSQTYAGRR